MINTDIGNQNNRNGADKQKRRVERFIERLQCLLKSLFFSNFK
jgi:hypothetical protein